jgi:TRAP-type uncharacterized transport system substrate-binding protein
MIRYLLVFLFTTQLVYSDPQKFLVAADSSSKTYAEMLGQLQTVCGDDQTVIEQIQSTGGALGNLEQLVNNKANAAFLHSDIIYLKAMTDSTYRKFKTLVNLYPEEIHVVALRTANERTKGYGGTKIGSESVVYESLADLADLKVGAAGGSVLTAKIISGTGGGNFDVVPFNKGDEVLAALRNGDIQAGIFVGGSPLPNILALNADEFKLLPVGESITSKVTGDSGVYKNATVSYTNLGADNIKTISTSAIIVTKMYTVPKFVKPQHWFRNCFYEHLTELQETPNTHRKWAEINPEDHGTWEWYEFSSVAQPVVKTVE